MRGRQTTLPVPSRAMISFNRNVADAGTDFLLREPGRRQDCDTGPNYLALMSEQGDHRAVRAARPERQFAVVSPGADADVDQRLGSGDGDGLAVRRFEQVVDAHRIDRTLSRRCQPLGLWLVLAE